MPSGSRALCTLCATTFSLLFVVSGASAQAAPQIIDNGDAGYSTVGAWAYAGNQGYLGDVDYKYKGNGSETAIWTFENLTPGGYQVWVTWTVDPNRASDAPYTVTDGVASETVDINQELVPSDLMEGGVGWKSLGIFPVDGSTLSVTLSDDANEYVIADAVRIQQVSMDPEITVRLDNNDLESGVGIADIGETFQGASITKQFVIRNDGLATLHIDSINVPAGFTLSAGLSMTDILSGEAATFTVRFNAGATALADMVISSNDSDEGAFEVRLRGTVSNVIVIDDAKDYYNFFISGNWSYAQGVGFDGDTHYVLGGAGAGTYVQWRSNSNTPQGRYRVSATWVPHENRATNVKYLMWDNGPLQVVLNQENAPSDFQDRGVWWEELGVIRPGTSGVEVFLTSEGNEYVIADAIRIEWLDAPPPPVEEVGLDINITDPAILTFSPDDNDAVLAEISLFPMPVEQLNMSDLFVVVQGKTSTNAGFGGDDPASDEIHEVMEDVELRNHVTGQVIQGERLTGINSTDGDYFTSPTETFQVYRFQGLLSVYSHDWQLRADFIDNGANAHPREGDAFRIHICSVSDRILSGGVPVANPALCTFGGLISGSIKYQLKGEDVATGTPVTYTQPVGTITGNYHSISRPELFITVKNIGTTDVAVSNQKNVNLLQFEAFADETEDILFTKAVFEAAQGTLLNGNNYTMWVDTDNDLVVDTILQSGVAAQGGLVTFNELAGGGFVVPKEEAVRFEIHVDIASSLSDPRMLRLAFNEGASNYVEAEELDDGSALVGIKTNANCPIGFCQIIVTPTDSQLWNFENQGDLYVTKDSTPLRSRQLLGGALSDVVLRMEFHAETEPSDVYKLQIPVIGDAVSIDRAELYKAGDSTPFATATVGGCASDPVPAGHKTFCANMQNRQLVIEEGVDTDVLVRLRMKNDVAGAISQESIRVNITGDDAVRARGDTSSNNLSTNDGDTIAEGEVFVGTPVAAPNVAILGNQNQSVLSKITAITNANPDANGTSVPTGVAPIGQFKISAAAHTNSKNGLNDVVLSDIVFNVNATNVSLGSFKFYNKADASTKQDCAIYDVAGVLLEPVGSAGVRNGSLLVRCDGLVAHTVSTEIDQGTDETFVLETNVANPDIVSQNTSTLLVSLQNFDSITRDTYGVTAGNSHFRWNDTDTDSTTFTWVEYPDTVVNSTTYQS